MRMCRLLPGHGKLTGVRLGIRVRAFPVAVMPEAAVFLATPIADEQPPLDTNLLNDVVPVDVLDRSVHARLVAIFGQGSVVKVVNDCHRIRVEVRSVR